MLFFQDPKEGGDGLIGASPVHREIWSKVPAVGMSSEAGLAG